VPVEPQPIIQVPPDFEAEYPDGSALATECVMNFGALGGAVIGQMRALVQRRGVSSIAAFNVLAIIDGAGEPLAQSTIAERLLVARPTVTGILDSLEKRGMARRRPDERDGRVRMVELTATGRRTVRALLPELHRFEHDVMAGLTIDEQRSFLRSLARLQSNMMRLAPEAEFKTPD